MIKTTIGVEGMMCGHCEARVNEALKKAFAVGKVTSDHGKKQTEVLSDAELDESKVRAVIEAEGFKVTDFSSEPYQKKGFFSWK